MFSWLYEKVISSNFLVAYRKKIINIHPSLLPKFKGLNTFKRIIDNQEKRRAAQFIMLMKT